MRSLRLLVLGLTGAIVLATQVLGGNWTPHQFFYKPSVGARGEQEKNLFDAGLDRIDTRLSNETWVNDPPYGGSLSSAITAIGTDKVTLRVPAGTWTITNKLTIPANITLKPESGAVLGVTIPDVDIQGLTKGTVTTVTWTGHGLATGDRVSFSGITQAGWKYFNTVGALPITKINDNSFSVPINTSSGTYYPAPYDPGTDPGIITKTLCLKGGLEAGAYQIFSAAPGKVVFEGNCRIMEILPSWWGAVADNSTDCSAAIRAAVRSVDVSPTAVGGATIKFAPGVYLMNTGVTLPNLTDWSSFPRALQLRFIGYGAALRCPNDNVVMFRKMPVDQNWANDVSYYYIFEGLNFVGNLNRYTTAIELGSTRCTVIRNCEFDYLGTGIRLAYPFWPKIENCNFYQFQKVGIDLCDGYGLWDDAPVGAQYGAGQKIDTCHFYATPSLKTDIEGLSRANPCVVTWTGHGLMDGEEVFFNEINQTQWAGLNLKRYYIKKINNNSFSLYSNVQLTTGVDTSGFAAAYVPGTMATYNIEGLSREAACTVTWTGHGLNTGDYVFFSGITAAQWANLNNQGFVITKVNDNSFTINYDTSAFTSAYVPASDPGKYGKFGYIAKRCTAVRLQYGIVDNCGFECSGVTENINVDCRTNATTVFIKSMYNEGSVLGSCIYFRSGGRLNIDGIGNNSANLVIDAHDPVSGSGSIILKNGSLTWPAAFRCPETGTPSNYTYWTMEEMNQPYETTDYTLPQYWYAGIQPLPGVTLIRNTGARFVNSPLAGTKFATIDGASAYNQGGLSVWHPKHGQLMSLMQNSAEVTMSANPTTNWQGIPAGSLVVGVTARVTQAITGVDSIDIGPYGGTVDLWGHAVGTSLGTTSNLANGTATTPLIFTALSYVTITGNGGLGHFTGGKVRLTVHYLKLTAPTD